MFKKFIHYYKPYKGIFFIDLLSATIIAAIDGISGDNQIVY